MTTTESKLKLFILYKVLCEKLVIAVDLGMLSKDTADRFLKIGINDALMVESDDKVVAEVHAELMVMLDLKEINDFINSNYDRIKEEYLPEYELLYNSVNCGNN